MRGPLRRPWLLVALVLAVGIAGTAIALASHEGNTQFAAQQQGLLPVSAGALERLILTTSDPRPGYGGGRALDARCTTASASALGNPWTCLVRYPRLPRIGYRVTVRADRSIYGTGRPEGAVRYATPLTVKGCCVNAP
ncbi:MAG: hypothetical protein ACLQQB_00780 [Solirubrobacteraceae bacterium]|jgi:hypothetical protein